MGRSLSVTFGLTALLFASVSYSQTGCQSPEWLASPGFPGTSGPIKDSTLWDPDGDGPAQPLVVVCGDFKYAGDLKSHYLALYNPADGSWQGFGNHINAVVNAVAVSESNKLIIGGGFTSIGSEDIRGIATWDGHQWSELGTGISGEIVDIVDSPGNGIVVAGIMSQVGTLGPQDTARWDGSTWRAMTLPDYPIMPYSLHVAPGGQLYVGGHGIVAEWNGSEWESIATPTGRVACMASLPNGDLVIGGDFRFIRTGVIPNYSYYEIEKVARWDGHKWHAIGHRSEILSPVTSIVMANDMIMAGTDNDLYGPLIWTGQAWVSTARHQYDISTYTLQSLPDGRIVAGGSIRSNTKSQAWNMMIWDGLKWSLPHNEINGTVYCIDIDDTGRIALSGDLTNLDGKHTGHLAVWDGDQWQGIPTPYMSGFREVFLLDEGRIAALTPVPGGRLLVREDSEWTIYGSQSEFYSAMAKTPEGELIAGRMRALNDGGFSHELIRLDGNAWTLIAPPVDSTIRDIGYHEGKFFVATNQSIEVWDGSAWTTLVDQPFGQFDHLLIRHDGSLAATGSFKTASNGIIHGVAVWDGQSWITLGSGVDNTIQAMVELPDQRLLIGGWFQTVDGKSISRLAVWDGQQWDEFAGGSRERIEALALHPDGTLYVGGYLAEVGSTVSPFLARYGCPTPTCLADTNGDGILSPADFSAWVAAFNSMATACDQNGDGSCTPADFSAWVANYNAGCD